MLADPFARLRRDDPVHWHVPSSAWLVTRHDDVRTLLADRRLSSQTGAERADALTRWPALAALYGDFLSMTDGSRHRELRQALAPVFAAGRLAAWEPELERIARACAAAAGDATEYAARYSVASLCALLGVRRDEVAWLRARVTPLVGLLAGAPPDEARLSDADRALSQLRAHLAEAPQGMAPARPLLSDVADPHLRVALFVQLFSGGLDPVTSCLAGALDDLAGTAPDARGWLRDEASLETGVDELVRRHGPFPVLPRVVAAPVEVRGRLLGAGDRVLLAIGAANLDETAYADPHRFSLDRETAHLSFGWGPHRCPAAGLARMQVRVALRAVA